MATSVCRGRGFSRVQNLHVAEVLAEVTRPFTQPWDFGDVTFIVQRKRIYVNKAVLMMSSEVFNAMFTADFAEKKMTEIPLPDKKFDDFLELMKIVHPQILKRLDESNIESLLPLAHEYQMHHVVENCEKYLLDQPSIHNLILADKFSLSKLRIACAKYVKEIPYSKLKKDPEFEILGQDTLLEVFQYKLWGCKDPSKNYKLQSITVMFAAQDTEKE